MTTKVKYIADNVVTVDQIDLSTLSTSNVSEGTNLYYTDARVGAYLTANSYATQSYVGTELANLVDSSPATLDTLNELAAALGDDPNFATTVTNSIATKLPLSGGTLTGTLNAQTIVPDNLYVKHTGVAAGVASTDINQIQIGEYLYLQHTSYINAPVISVNARLTESDYIGAPVDGAADLNKWSPIYAAGGFVIQQGNASGDFGIATGPWNSATSLNNIDPLLSSTYRRLYIDSGGRVTFGSGSSATNSRGGTATKLLVKMDNSQEYLDIQAASTSANSSLLFSDGSTGAYGAVQYLHSNDSMQIYTNSSPRITITSAGNVGISTTDPKEKLHVSGGGIKVDGTSGIPSNSGAGLFLQYDSGNNVGTITALDQSVAWKSLLLNAADIQFWIAGGERMRVHSNGNVGIGSSGPAEKLEIKAGTSYTAHAGSALKLINAGYRGSELTSFTEGSYFTHYFENYTGGNGRPYDRVLEIVCKGAPDGTYGESIIKFMGNPITNGSNVSELMRITGSGKVGIGTQSPPSRLAVVEATNYDPPGLGSSGGHFGIFKTDSNASGDYGIMWGVKSSGDAWQQVQRRDGTATAYHLLLQPSGGNVGIGLNSTPLCALHVAGDITSVASSTGAVNLRLQRSSSSGRSQITFENETGSTAYWRIGLTGPGSQDFSYFNGTVNALVLAHSSGAATFSGDVTIGGTLTETSTIREKENVRNLTDSLAKVTQLQGVLYDRKDGTTQNEPGMIAEEVLKVIPELVSFDDEGNPAGLKYSKTVAYLVESIKELHTKVQDLESKLNG